MSAKRKGLEYDQRNMRFKKSGGRFGRSLLYALGYVLSTFTLAVLVYLLFALFFRTDTERRLRREIRMYEQVYPTLLPKAELIGDAVANLQHKDNEIYEQVFHANAPDVDPMGRMNSVYASDTIPDTRLSSYTLRKADRLLSEAAGIEAAFGKIFERIGESDFVMPPMSLPVKDITYPQIGASTGSKMDPLYKAYVYHEGLDIIVSRGTPVCSSADGVVIGSSSNKKQGNTVEIRHEGGYVTVYAHLESRSVRAGQSVSAGQTIGTVGMSGKTSAPHLHYEIRKDGVLLDPVNYLFGSVSPSEYVNMLFMAVNTKQSLD